MDRKNGKLAFNIFSIHFVFQSGALRDGRKPTPYSCRLLCVGKHAFNIFSIHFVFQSGACGMGVSFPVFVPASNTGKSLLPFLSILFSRAEFLRSRSSRKSPPIPYRDNIYAETEACFNFFFIHFSSIDKAMYEGADHILQRRYIFTCIPFLMTRAKCSSSLNSLVTFHFHLRVWQNVTSTSLLSLMFISALMAATPKNSSIIFKASIPKQSFLTAISSISGNSASPTGRNRT